MLYLFKDTASQVSLGASGRAYLWQSLKQMPGFYLPNQAFLSNLSPTFGIFQQGYCFILFCFEENTQISVDSHSYATSLRPVYSVTKWGVKRYDLYPFSESRLINLPFISIGMLYFFLAEFRVLS